MSTMALASEAAVDRPAARERTGVSVLIMTCNEEANLPACLASLTWCDDIVVLDSFSTDRTIEIAQAAGARIVQRAYDTENQQRMYGLKEIGFRHPWVYTPDADEVTPADLRDEMLAIAADPARPEAFFMARYRNMFMGRWVRHASLYPTWITRLVRPDRVRLERQVHSVCVSDAPMGRLQAHFVHYSFNKGLHAWYEKHNRYSSVEAGLAIARPKRALEWPALLSRDPAARRRALKQMSFRVPFRPTLRFLYMYLIRLGFLDGWPGYVYCRLISHYEFMIVVKTEELRRRARGESI